MYCPRIKRDSQRKLYFLKVAYTTIGIRKPITKIVNEAIEKHIPAIIREIQLKGGTIPNELNRDQKLPWAWHEKAC